MKDEHQAVVSILDTPWVGQPGGPKAVSGNIFSKGWSWKTVGALLQAREGAEW